MKNEKVIKKEMEVVKVKALATGINETDGGFEINYPVTLEFYIPAELRDDIEIKSYIERNAFIGDRIVAKIIEKSVIRVLCKMKAFDFLNSSSSEIEEE